MDGWMDGMTDRQKERQVDAYTYTQMHTYIQRQRERERKRREKTLIHLLYMIYDRLKNYLTLFTFTWRIQSELHKK